MDVRGWAGRRGASGCWAIRRWDEPRLRRSGIGRSIEHLQGRLFVERGKARVQVRTHQFARRQETWFRSLSECRRIEQDGAWGAVEMAARLVDLGQSNRLTPLLRTRARPFAGGRATSKMKDLAVVLMAMPQYRACDLL